MLILKNMSELDFNIVKGKMIADYAKDKVKVGHWSEEESLDLSRESLEKILKKGIFTPDHYLLNVHEDDMKIGFVWLNSYKNEIYINNSFIYEQYQTKEYEFRFLKTIEKKALELHAKKINIHSYGFELKNINLYKEIGYGITDIYLTKVI